MKIIEIAREHKEVLNEGIAYVAVWQQVTNNGRRSWFAEDFFPEDSDESSAYFSTEDKTRLAEIAAIDPDAVLLNGYYHSWIGSVDDPLNAADISNGLKKHYEMHNALIRNYLNAGDEPAAEPEATKPDKRDLPRLYTLKTPRGEIYIAEEFTTHDEAAAEGYGEYFSTALGTVYSYGDDHTFALVTSSKAGDWDTTTMGQDFRGAMVSDNHGGEYDADGQYIQGTGETVCSPEDGMQPSDVPDTITIAVPFTGNEDILRALLQSKATLITAALGEDAYWHCPEDEYSTENPGGWYGPAPSDNTLPIEFADGTVKFEWLRFGADSEVIKSWSVFLCAAVNFAKAAKRITAKDKPVESEKFAFRTFMVKIGMNTEEFKSHRKLLLRNLAGDAAFATKASKEKWLEKHGSKKTEVADGE